MTDVPPNTPAPTATGIWTNIKAWFAANRMTLIMLGGAALTCIVLGAILF